MISLNGWDKLLPSDGIKAGFLEEVALNQLLKAVQDLVS